MQRNPTYGGSLTAEQFLFHEIRITAQFYLAGQDLAKAIERIETDNLFQYPTERQIGRITKACYKRLAALNNETLIQELAFASRTYAKQINLYAIMRYNALVWDFMVQVIGEKYQNSDFTFSRKDINAFFTHLQTQNDAVAAWSEATINKIKSVLVRILVKTGYLDDTKATALNPVLLCDVLAAGIRANHDEASLIAFNQWR